MSLKHWIEEGERRKKLRAEKQKVIRRVRPVVTDEGVIEIREDAIQSTAAPANRKWEARNPEKVKADNRERQRRYRARKKAEQDG